ncbi:MAG TPA: hypothetical protein P5553_14580 [Desulfomonilia bacterium]|nr:hypothetical protein [Desulfomonilia bacterium]
MKFLMGQNRPSRTGSIRREASPSLIRTVACVMKVTLRPGCVFTGSQSMCTGLTRSYR